MPVNGITVSKNDGFVVCYIDSFSEEIKELIRNELAAICHGKNQVEEDTLGHYSYRKTLEDFLNRYSRKDGNTKKGMIGEFLAHLIICRVLDYLKPISIFFNKEEISIKKGFDLNYVEKDGDSIWYGEIKSGEVTEGIHYDDKNTDLLNLAKKDMAKYHQAERAHLWESVISDAMRSFAAGESKRVQDLLKMDLQDLQRGDGAKKNAILISVLFHTTDEMLDPKKIKEKLSSIITEDLFSKVILFSIQKSTYQRIEAFMREELANQSDV